LGEIRRREVGRRQLAPPAFKAGSDAGQYQVRSVVTPKSQNLCGNGFAHRYAIRLVLFVGNLREVLLELRIEG
jgi:hypothetical protein